MKQFFLNNWIKIIELLSIIWAINGIMLESRSCSLVPKIGGGSNCVYYLPSVLAYFLSAVLILYLLRKYKKNN